jgi:hypothetical protein
MTYTYTYRHPTELSEVARTLDRCMVWSYRGAIRTVREGNHYHKTRFANEEDQNRTLDEFKAAGGRGAPSSWGDIFHRFFRSPRPHPGILHDLRGRVSAGWQEARRTGPLEGAWWTYDIVSAYAWAASRGLPRLKSGHPCTTVKPGGIYKVRFKEATAPHPPNLRSGALMTAEEVEHYGLTGVDVESGVVFRKHVSIARDLDGIRDRFSQWKKIFRAFWGAWIANSPTTCEIWERGRPVKGWESTRPLYNPAWAQTITSAIRIRVGEHAKRAAHIFVDSVMVDYDIPQGDDLGAWKVSRWIQKPVIFGAGRYGDLGEGKLQFIKHAGTRIAK